MDNRLIEDGHTIVFLGDSITQAPAGYVSVTQQMIGALAPDVRVRCINAGIGGNKVGDMLERVGDDVIAHNPDWVTVSVGINDVWHGINGTPIDVFKEKYDELIRRLMDQTEARLALFTTTVIGERLDSEENRKLRPYNDFIRQVAKKRNLLLVEMNEVFHDAIRAWQKTGGGDLRSTTDGVHMKPEGDYLMSLTLLRAWRMI